MVVIKVMGGLGNQMFQYALYRSLRAKGINASLDLNFYKNNNEHNGYELEKVFGIHPKISNDSFFNNSVISKIIRKVFKNIFVYEHDFVYMDDIFSYRNKYLIGYWQNEKYFKEIKYILIHDFLYVLDDEENKNISELMKENNSVSIHIRRGDYIDKSNYSSHYVIRNNNYYIRAIDYIESKIQNPVYFVFSDDPEWVKENLNINNAIYVTCNRGEDSFKDMILMSKCKHNIIANSTFSWWGAWLNQNDQKIVISPEIWLNNVDASNVICNDWITMSVK